MRGTALLLKRALILVLLGASIWILGAWTRDHASVLSMTRRALQTDEDPSNPVPALLNFESERAHRQPLETQHQATGTPTNVIPREVCCPFPFVGRLHFQPLTSLYMQDAL